MTALPAAPATVAASPRGFARLAAKLAEAAESSKEFGRRADRIGRAALRLRLHADPDYRAVYVAGREARAYVAAGLDPALATEDALAAYVADVLRDDVLSAADRAAVAARALEGWARHRGDAAAESSCWHRWIGGRAVVVTRG